MSVQSLGKGVGMWFCFILLVLGWFGFIFAESVA